MKAFEPIFIRDLPASSLLKAVALPVVSPIDPVDDPNDLVFSLAVSKAKEV